ncbi:MAG: hypothetical protein HOQ07_11940 [Sinomonas sp.]|nr:hypothetical protein [Sinomonas sp.]
MTQRSSSELIELAEHALRTGQPALARLYLNAAEVAKEREHATAPVVLEAERLVFQLAVLLAPLYGVTA